MHTRPMSLAAKARKKFHTVYKATHTWNFVVAFSPLCRVYEMDVDITNKIDQKSAERRFKVGGRLISQ